jgi:hypothetical protein
LGKLKASLPSPDSFLAPIDRYILFRYIKGLATLNGPKWSFPIT